MDHSGGNLTKHRKKYSRPVASHCDRSVGAFGTACFSYDLPVGALQPDGP